MKILLFPLILITLISFGSNDKGELLTIDVPEKTELYNLSEIVSEIEALRLETTNECLMSSVVKFEITDSYYFFFSNNRVMMFDKEGKFIRQIGTIGRGPSEYQSISTFAVDESNELVYLAADARKIMCFNFKGKFIREKRSNKMNNYIDVINNEIYNITSDEPITQKNGSCSIISRLYRLNDKLEVKDSLLVRDLHLPITVVSMDGFGRYISDIGDELFLFFPSLSKEQNVRDTLYRINGNKLEPFVKIRFNDAYKDLESFTMRNMYRTKRYLFAEYFIAKRNRFYFCYDMEDGRKMNMEVGFNDDILNTGVAKLEPLDPANGLMYFVKQANEVTGVIDGVDEFDNPVIIFVQLKE